MAKHAQELYAFLKDMNKGDAAVIPGIVKAVNADDTIDVDVDGLTFFDVRIKAAVKNGQKGISIKPAIDSVVMMERIGGEESKEYQCILYSELDEYSIEIGTVKMLMDANGILLQKGTDSLKDILKLIIEATQQIVVLMGNNPNYQKLVQALTKTNNLLK